jgi:hypothetical protein
MMRGVISAFISIVICMSVSGQEKLPGKLEAEGYTINESALPGSAPVAFSIGYPKGWTKAENTTPFMEGGTSVEAHQVVCSFTTPFDSAGIQTNYAFMTIFRAYGASAREEAEHLAARMRKMSDEVRSLTPIRTKAGDSGYLLIAGDEAPNGHRLRSEFFFRVGSKGHIQISIYVMGTFLGMRESLQNLVLESLRFPQG